MTRPASLFGNHQSRGFFASVPRASRAAAPRVASLLPAAHHGVGALDAWDTILELALPLAQLLPHLDVAASRLARLRRDETARLVQSLRPHVEALTPAVRAGEAGAIASYDALLASAVATLRGLRAPGVAGNLLALDRAFYQDGEEWSDTDRLPQDARVAVIERLHRFNVHSGNYARWHALLQPMLAQAAGAGQRPIRLLDVAAGTGGFCISLKQRLGDAIAVTASDIYDGYLDVGARRADAAGLAVDFRVLDAAHASELADGAFDIITCTQSLHHFTPGLAARMLGECARVATTGVCFIDGERGLPPLFLMAPFMALYGRDWPVVRDTIVSVRRMYLVEEMHLLASLAPIDIARAHVESGRMGPGHGFVALRHT